MTRSPLWLAPLIALIALVVGWSSGAHAFVRSVNSNGQPLTWGSSCIPLTVHLDGFPGIPAEEVRAAVTAAIDAWSAPAVACSGVRLPVTFAIGEGPPPTLDGVNVVGARPDLWCEAPAAAPQCFSPTATAVTTLFITTKTGVLREADINLNTVKFSWGQATPGAETRDLQATLTREIGRLLGFDQPCRRTDGPTVRAAVDDRNIPIPDCKDATPEMRASVMFPGEPGDPPRRTLSAEDQRGVCAVYAAASAPPACPAAEESAGCAVAGKQNGAAGWALAGLLALVWRRRRRR